MEKSLMAIARELEWGFGTKDFEGRSVSDLKGWGKRLEMAAEMCELMQKRVDF